MRLILHSLTVIFVVMLLYAVERINVMRLGYEMEDLKTEKKNLEQIHNSLLIEKAALTSVERIEKIATSYLEMRKPDNNQIILVKERRNGNSGFVTTKATIKEKDTGSPLKIVKYFDWRFY